jgi:hypothetical protein
LLNAEHKSDTIFVLDNGEQIHAHRFLLCARSPYFDQMFSSGECEVSVFYKDVTLVGLKEEKEKQVIMRETDPNAFKVALKHIYTDSLNIEDVSGEFVCELFLLAHRVTCHVPIHVLTLYSQFGLPSLLSLCEKFISDGLEVCVVEVN